MRIIVIIFYFFQNTLPLSAALFRGPKHIQPACPPRLDLQVMKASYWARVPNTSLKAHSIKMSEVRGWSLVCEEPGKKAKK